VNSAFLPVSRDEMLDRGWYYYDFLLVTGDAYVDHPSFGTPLIGRMLESLGYRTAILAQPDWKSPDAFIKMGRPRYAAFISAGNLDSMVAHYTAAKRKRGEDYYSPGKKTGLRPDRASIVYSNRVKEAFEGLPVIVGGLEASLRRFAHYDYWEDKVKHSLIMDAGADLLVYGMGEKATAEIAGMLSQGVLISEIKNIRGTARLSRSIDCGYKFIECPSFESVRDIKREYASACEIQYEEHDPFVGRAVVQKHADRFLIVNPPQPPLGRQELDKIAGLPFTREAHPMYSEQGGVPAIEEVRFSVIHNRGCFGACNFCSLAFHQGRTVTSRSHESVIREAEEFTRHPLFKGYVHDVGGPTANFRNPSCAKQLKNGLCKDKNCLTPKPCANLNADHSDYLALLRKLRAIPGVKKVFIRSGIRFDFLLQDKSGEFFAELVKHHISGQLKVAPEHCVDEVLACMGKPQVSVYEQFMDKYRKLNEKYRKEQYVVPYLMSSHPGCTLNDAVRLAEYLHKSNIRARQVQDFYPTPGTLSTCMYYTGLDPRDMSEVYVPRGYHEKEMQRALLQWHRPENRSLVLEALTKTGRKDLIARFFGKQGRTVKEAANERAGSKRKKR
jgi:uncharacterized radical SAM protein YgiQ